ncbi:magnesium-dependent phosphatase 1 isoform X1 [Leucoraja erinacea]|uniref:magnesium-dependent phosphatase 1 isoform X1 n=1 Tax=Leucoraja erinaceus TaxID=7782 RepID=UPI002456FBD4|nr:magnesium-dependent phosphatase 1 isoform X1 [Leucoraja erinacea]
MAKPKLVVFDLGRARWRTARAAGCACNREVGAVMERLRQDGILIAVASRTGEVEGANQLLHLFKLDQLLCQREIYTGSKVTHFRRLKDGTGLQYNQMIFFDDEERNILEVGKLGVLSVLVPRGMTVKLLDDGLAEFSRRAAGGR